MAQIEAWLWDRLATGTLIVEAEDGVVAGRVFPMFGPQSYPEPFITFTRTSTLRQYHSGANDGEPTATFQIDCWDTDYRRLKSWADAVRQTIDGYKGEPTGFVVLRAFVTDESDQAIQRDPGAETGAYGVQFTYEVCHTETVVQYT